MAAIVTLMMAAIVVLLPGVAAVRWARAHCIGALDPAHRIALVYAGLGVSCIALWLAALVFGLSGATSVLAPLAVALVLVLSARIARRHRSAENDSTTADPEARRHLIALTALSLVSVLVVLIPFATYGLERADGVHRMAMTDWEKHLVMTTGIAASATFPPPHPYIEAVPDPSYYFGYHLVAAAVRVASLHVADAFPTLLLLTLLTAAATPFVVYTFACDLCAPRQAVIAAGGASLLVGFDAIVMLLQATRAIVSAWPLPAGMAGLRAAIPSTHIDFWIHNVDRQFNAPIITTMWAPHQTAATLIALLALYLLAPRPDDPRRARAGWLLPALLIASLPALSAYVALGLGAGIAAVMLVESTIGRQVPWNTSVFRRWALPGAVAVALALPVLPTLTSGSSSGLILHVSTAGTWSNGALASWWFGPRQWTNLIDTPAVYLMEFGVIGLLGVAQIVRLRQQGFRLVQREAATIALSIALVVIFVRPPVGIGNNLYARALLLSWFILAPFAASAARRIGTTPWLAAAVLVGAMGTAYAEVGYLLEGGLFWGVPRDNVQVLRWVNDHTEPDALVAIRPTHYDNTVGYWLRRPLVLGGRRLALLFGAEAEVFDATERALERAYSQTDAAAAAREFDALHADVILVRGSNQEPRWVQSPCFAASYSNDSWLAVLRTRENCPVSGPNSDGTP